MNGPQTNDAGVPDAEEGVNHTDIAKTNQGATAGHPDAFKGHVVKRTPIWVLKGIKPKGRPSKAQIKAEKKLAVIVERNKPTVEELEKHQGPFTWGGRRLGAGRKKGSKGKTHLPARKLAMVRMDPELAAKLEALPAGKRSEYVRQALDLMSDIQPPEKFLASGKRNGQGAV